MVDSDTHDQSLNKGITDPKNKTSSISTCAADERIYQCKGNGLAAKVFRDIQDLPATWVSRAKCIRSYTAQGQAYVSAIYDTRLLGQAP